MLIVFWGLWMTSSLSLPILAIIEHRALRQALSAALDASAGPAVQYRDGDLVVAEGRIRALSYDSRIPGLVVGASERMRGTGKRSSWQWEFSAQSTFALETTRKSRIVVRLRRFQRMGAYHVVSDTSDSKHRWIGYREGDTVSCIGVVGGTSPIFIEAGDMGCYGGALAAFRGYPNEELAYAAVVGALGVAVGVLAAWLWRRA